MKGRTAYGSEQIKQQASPPTFPLDSRSEAILLPHKYLPISLFRKYQEARPPFAKIKNILYATDLTQNSAYAFRYAINSAQKHDAQIHILHVLEKVPPSVEGIIGMYMDLNQLHKIWEEKKQAQVKPDSGAAGRIRQT